MSKITDEEWTEVVDSLVRGGLRDTIDALIRERVSGNPLPTWMNLNNLLLLYRAYDDGDGNTVKIRKSSTEGYFEGEYDGEYVMEGTVIDGVLYSICPQSSGGTVAVLVGDELIKNFMGVPFPTIPEARSYIQGLAAK